MEQNITNKFIKLEIVSPNNFMIDESCYLVNIPAKEGQMGVMYGHMTMVVEMIPGLLVTYDALKKTTHKLYVTGGYAEINNYQISIICNDFISSSSFNIVEAKNQKATLEKALQDIKDEEKKVELIQQYQKYVDWLNINSTGV